MVRTLVQFLKLHLDVEENLMKRVEYPAYLAHKEHHQTLLEKMAVISERTGQGVSVAAEVRTLMDSFVKHHDHTDRPLMAFIESKLGKPCAPVRVA